MSNTWLLWKEKLISDRTYKIKLVFKSNDKSCFSQYDATECSSCKRISPLASLYVFEQASFLRFKQEWRAVTMHVTTLIYTISESIPGVVWQFNMWLSQCTSHLTWTESTQKYQKNTWRFKLQPTFCCSIKFKLGYFHQTISSTFMSNK